MWALAGSRAARAKLPFRDRSAGRSGTVHEESGEGGGGTVVVDARVGWPAVRAGGVVDGPGDGDFGGRGAGVGDAIAQDGDGESALVGVVGDEGGEGFERDADGEGGIGEIDAGEGELAGEGGGGEADEAGGVVGAESAGAFVGRLDARFEHAGDGLAGAGLHPDGGEGVGGCVAFVGAVEDFPVAELAASAERDGSGGDASEGEGDGGEVSSGEDARVGDLGCGRRRGGGGWGLGGALRLGWRRWRGPLAGGRCGAWWTSGIEYSHTARCGDLTGLMRWRRRCRNCS